MWYGAALEPGEPHGFTGSARGFDNSFPPIPDDTIVGEVCDDASARSAVGVSSVAFRPMHLLAVCAALTALAIGLPAWAGHIMFGVFFGVGLTLTGPHQRAAGSTVGGGDHRRRPLSARWRSIPPPA